MRRRSKVPKSQYQDELQEQFKDWLWERISERNMRPKELAQRAGVSQAAVSKWLNGKSLPSHDSTIRIARVFKVPRSEVARRASVPEDPTDPKQPLDASELDPDMLRYARDFNHLKPDHRMIVKAVLEAIYSAALRQYRRDDEEVQRFAAEFEARGLVRSPGRPRKST